VRVSKVVLQEVKRGRRDLKAAQVALQKGTSRALLDAFWVLRSMGARFLGIDFYSKNNDAINEVFSSLKGKGFLVGVKAVEASVMDNQFGTKLILEIFVPLKKEKKKS
jgi:hypothetical protein